MLPREHELHGERPAPKSKKIALPSDIYARPTLPHDSHWHNTLVGSIVQLYYLWGTSGARSAVRICSIQLVGLRSIWTQAFQGFSLGTSLQDLTFSLRSTYATSFQFLSDQSCCYLFELLEYLLCDYERAKPQVNSHLKKDSRYREYLTNNLLIVLAQVEQRHSNQNFCQV